MLDLVREQVILGHACQVLCLFESGQLADELKAAGVEVVACGKRRGLDARALRRLRDAIRAHGAELVHAHNGIRIDQFHVGDSEARNDLRRMLGWRESASVLGCVARLNAAKDHESLLRALQLVRVQYPQAGLVLVGDGALQASLEVLSADLRLDQAARFLGDRGDVAELVRGFDLFVLSSLTEGYSIALLEACAAGVPIVATRVGGNGEIVFEGRNGLLVEPRDPQAFARAVQSLLADRDTRSRMASKSRRFAAQYGSVKSVSARYLDPYRGLLSVDRPLAGPTGIA